MKSENPCPVCGFKLRRPADDYTICPSCGTQFGYSDSGRTFQQLRNEWIELKAPWHSKVQKPPKGWNPWRQLMDSGNLATVQVAESQVESAPTVFWMPQAPAYQMKVV